MAFNLIKSPLQSLTIWGALLTLSTVLEGVLEIVGSIPPELLPKEAQLVITLIGALLTVVGRIRAKATIKL